MNAIRRLPPTGTNTPLARLSSLPSMVSCTKTAASAAVSLLDAHSLCCEEA
jgi:hypothetical protein